MSLAYSFGALRRVNFYDARIKEINVDEDEGLKWDSLIRYHFKIDPEPLSDDAYFKLVAGLEWVIRQENEKHKNKD